MPLSTSMIRPAVLMPAFEYLILASGSNRRVTSRRQAPTEGKRSSWVFLAEANGSPPVWLGCRDRDGMPGLLQERSRGPAPRPATVMELGQALLDRSSSAPCLRPRAS